MDHDFKFYIIAFVLALLAIASMLTLNIFLILFSLIICGILIVFYKLSYIIEAIVFRRTNLIQIIDGCELSGERTTAIRRIGNSFCATAVAFLENSSSESIEKEKIENIISNSHTTFRFVMQVEKVDINKLLDKLQTRRSMKEIELSRLHNSTTKINILKANSLKREIDQLEHDIEKISTGGAPLKVAQYLMTSAISDSKSNAQEKAKSQLRELVGEFGALLGSKAEILTGNDLIQLLKFDATMMQ